MWLIFVVRMITRWRESGGGGANGKRHQAFCVHQERNRGKFNFLQCLLLGCFSGLLDVQMRSGKGIKSVIKYSKRYSWKNITFIHKLCMRGCYHIFSLVGFLYYTPKHVYTIFSFYSNILKLSFPSLKYKLEW